MPELPEVETIARAVNRSLVGAVLVEAKFFRKDVRVPIPVEKIRANLQGKAVIGVSRRSKYLLIETQGGIGLFHLGMSGVIDINTSPTPLLKHTHAVFTFRCCDGEERYLHFVDPRRFGKIGFIPPGSKARDQEFSSLGVEPLERGFDLGEHLWTKSRGKSVSVKNFIMDQGVVVGVGNIYASESLYRARLSPQRIAGKVSRQNYDLLAERIRQTLEDAIAQGGTSFRDFRHVDGSQGYFEVHLNVYGRDGETCRTCMSIIKQLRQGGRSTFYCPKCQK